MGIELVLVYIALGLAGAFGVDKGVDYLKHSKTIGADRYHSCIEATKDARECRTLE